MECCLYHPQYGYYRNRDEERIGRRGDFFTSVSVGAGFGYFLGMAIEDRWERDFGRRQPFLVVEQGAHDGQLAVDLVTGLLDRGSGLVRPGGFRYLIQEPEADRAARIERRLEAAGLSEYVGTVPAPPPVPAAEGIFLCNELVDAFPVCRVIRQSGAWRELRVGREPGDRLDWVISPLPPEGALGGEAGGICASGLPEGYETELSLHYDPWMAEVSRWFGPRGLWWVIDYGFEREDYFSPERREGTLRCYRDHRLVPGPFEALGGTDITADVNFTRLDESAAKCGLRRRSLSDQHHFLIRAAEGWLRRLEEAGPAALAGQRRHLRQFQTLTHPDFLGRSFKVVEYATGEIYGDS